jgi:hypothetical protein
MKNIFAITAIALLSSCSLLSPDKPKEREEYRPCEGQKWEGDYAACARHSVPGGICFPSKEYHSAPDKCKLIK